MSTTESKEDLTLSIAITTISKHLKDDSEYAWAWLCNLAVPMMDEGVSHESANRSAARIISIIFGVDVTAIDEWKNFERDWESSR